jgi:putative two-component system response regulator
VDYVTKPFHLAELRARLETHLRIRKLRRRLEQAKEELEERVRTQVREISEAQLATILALAKLAEYRDDETGRHLDRVGPLCRVLAEQIAREPDFPGFDVPDFVENLVRICPLHDIGKVGIEDRVLRKPGPLTPEEFEVMKRHVLIGAETLRSVLDRYPGNRLQEMGIRVARYHHERWDGEGYPEGLAGEAIPLSARIMAVVDVYDALRSVRCYKPPLSHEAARTILLEGEGTRFDPRVVRAFRAVEEEFRRIYDAPSG